MSTHATLNAKLRRMHERIAHQQDDKDAWLRSRRVYTPAPQQHITHDTTTTRSGAVIAFRAHYLVGIGRTRITWTSSGGYERATVLVGRIQSAADLPDRLIT